MIGPQSIQRESTFRLPPTPCHLQIIGVSLKRSHMWVQPCCLYILVIIYFQQYLVPILPHPKPSAPAFTIGGLRLATERLYLAILPVYGPYLSQLKDLATWEDYGVSLMYCSVSFDEIEIFLDAPSFLNHDRCFGFSGGTTSWLLPLFSAY